MSNSFALTRIDLNSWLLAIAGYNILIDPWLVDPLEFYGVGWLFTANHVNPPIYSPQNLPPIDFMLISQGLDDHCHIPTLEKCDRKIPIIASPSAAKIVKSLGYEQVISLKSGSNYCWDNQLEISAIPGAKIQLQTENGYLLKDLNNGHTIYYEPHLPSDWQLLKDISPVDVVLAPVIGQIFPILGKVIMGNEEALKLTEILQPKYFVPTSLGEITTSGILPKLIRDIGTIDDFRSMLNHQNLPTKFITPQPAETITF